jgi:protein-disulfide isomerase
VQGQFWEMHDMLYRYQSVWAEATIANFFFESYAESIGLDVARFRADRAAPDVRARVIADATAGNSRGVKNTPTIFINGIELRTGFTKDKLQATIEAALAPKKTS